jgi:hypothetical protein
MSHCVEETSTIRCGLSEYGVYLSLRVRRVWAGVGVNGSSSPFFFKVCSNIEHEQGCETTSEAAFCQSRRLV